MPKTASTRAGKTKDAKPAKGKKTKGEAIYSAPESPIKKTKRAKKDPNAPKRGLSAYMFFANEQRDKLRQEQPNLKFGEVGKVLGERWKALTDAQKAPYEKKAAADKKRYEDEKAAYLAGGNVDDEDDE